MKEAIMIYIWDKYVNNLAIYNLSNFASTQMKKLGRKGAP